MVYSTKNLAELLGVTPQTVSNWRRAGEGPKWTRLGEKVVRYRKEDVEEFLAQGEGK